MKIFTKKRRGKSRYGSGEMTDARSGRITFFESMFFRNLISVGQGALVDLSFFSFKIKRGTTSFPVMNVNFCKFFSEQIFVQSILFL